MYRILPHYAGRRGFLSENTKNEALKKLDNLTIRVARPDDTEEMEIALQSVAGSDTDEEILVGKNGKYP